MDLKAVGHRIKVARKNIKMTQEELAELIDVSPHYIYEIERGSKAMSIQTLEKIAIELQQSIDFLFWGYSIPYNGNNISEDRLSTVIESLSPCKREMLADILTVIIPYLKS